MYIPDTHTNVAVLVHELNVHHSVPKDRLDLILICLNRLMLLVFGDTPSATRYTFCTCPPQDY